jgi:filamentous hemagglutinin
MAFGRGSTGRTALKNLKEQLAMEQATSNPTAGSPVFVKGGMKDTRWPASYGWVKMRHNVEGIEIHYVRNTLVPVKSMTSSSLIKDLR